MHTRDRGAMAGRAHTAAGGLRTQGTPPSWTPVSTTSWKQGEPPAERAGSGQGQSALGRVCSSTRNSVWAPKPLHDPTRSPGLGKTSAHPQSQPDGGKTRNFILERELRSTPRARQGLHASILGA